MKLGSNSVEDHPQLSHNRHPLDGALVGAGSSVACWAQNPTFRMCKYDIYKCEHLFDRQVMDII
jgi:hypothetical protein